MTTQNFLIPSGSNHSHFMLWRGAKSHYDPVVTTDPPPKKVPFWRKETESFVSWWLTMHRSLQWVSRFCLAIRPDFWMNSGHKDLRHMQHVYKKTCLNLGTGRWGSRVKYMISYFQFTELRFWRTILPSSSWQFPFKTVPSWKLTYPILKVLLSRWFSYSPGGICQFPGGKYPYVSIGVGIST